VRKPGGPHYRDHSAIKFAAGLLRVISVLIAFASIAAGWSLASLGRDLAPSVNLGPWPAIFVASVGLAQAVVLWAFADALILLADADDSHARIEFRLEQTRTDSAAEPIPAPTTSQAAGPHEPIHPEHVQGSRAYHGRPLGLVRVEANLLDAPDAAASTMARLFAGARVTLIGETRDFVFVESASGEGWLPRSAIEWSATAPQIS